MRQIVLADQYNTIEIINEERDLWVINTLIMLGVEPGDIYPENREVLFHYGIEVWDHLDNGDVEIIQNNVLVAKWYGPEVFARVDESNKVYYEIHLDYDSILDNEFHSPGEEE